MTTTDNTMVYSTTTDQGPDMELFEEFQSENLDVEGFLENISARDFETYEPWCFVCRRPTDHRGEHDDLVAEGKASYDREAPIVHRVF